MCRCGECFGCAPSIDEYMARIEAELRERKCVACHMPCRNTRHPDTLDYDRSLPECPCCVSDPPDMEGEA